MRDLFRIKINLLALLAVLLIGAHAVPAAADNGSHPNQRKTAVGHEDTDQRLPMVRVTIDRKSIDSVTTNVGDAYAVAADTMIVHSDGQQVSIRKMLIPCEAEVTYSTENGIRKATRIDIKQVGDNPTWKWSSRRPE